MKQISMPAQVMRGGERRTKTYTSAIKGQLEMGEDRFKCTTNYHSLLVHYSKDLVRVAM